MAVRIEVAADLQAVLHVGAVEIVSIDVQPANDALQSFCDQVAASAATESQNEHWEKQCQEVRQMLRFGKFKASGRSKPAQEYLLRCATTDGKLPVINGPVDLLNAVSLSCNLPISLLSISKCSENLWIERAKAGEQFVFNSVGQVIELADLITTYDRSSQPPRPVGTPIKDSMAGKIESTDNHLIAIIYAPNNPAAIERCNRAVELLADGMKSYCGAAETIRL